MNARITLCTLAVTLAASPALADYTITQGASAPTYTDHSVTFDEPGAPSGPMIGDEYLASEGILIGSGVGDGGSVDDWDAVYGPWGLGQGNSHVGAFGTFLTFDHDVTAMSLQVWNNGTDPFFGGIGLYLFNDGVEVGSLTGIPAWGGDGDAWWDLQATGGDVFDEVRVIDFDFSSFGIFSDTYSWNAAAVPAPGALALLGLAGLAARRRRG